MENITKPQSGRPSEERSETEQNCYDLLDSLGIEYTRVDHDPAMTMEDCFVIGDILGVRICKNLFLTNRQKTAFYLLLMPGDKAFRTKDLSAQIGSARLSFAGEETLQELLGLEPGSVSILGLMNDKEKRVRLLIDRDVLSEEYFGCHPCRNTTSLRLSVKDLKEKLLPALCDGYTEVTL